MNNLFNEETRKKAQEIVGQELKYKALCEVLGIEVKYGNSKKAQLKDLELCCDIERLEKPTRFRINEVYDEAFAILNAIKSNDKFQLAFDGVLFQALIRQNGYPLYASDLELVELFQEVNKNFAVTFTYSDMKKLGRKFEYMTEMSDIVYGILKQWTRRKLDSMQKRGIIRIVNGYRVYTEHVNSRGQTYVKKHDVPISTADRISELDQLCDKIYVKTKEAIIPPYVVTDVNGETKLCGYYPKSRLAEFEKALNYAIFKATEGKYCKLKRVSIIMPPDEEWMVDKLKDIYNLEPDFKNINEEACNKVLKTTQLDAFTNDERKQFILYNMTNNPPMSFKDELERIAEREKMKVEMEEEE